MYRDYPSAGKSSGEPTTGTSRSKHWQRYPQWAAMGRRDVKVDTSDVEMDMSSFYL